MRGWSGAREESRTKKRTLDHATAKIDLCFIRVDAEALSQGIRSQMGSIQLVGLLNVGKSKLLEVLTYHFAKQGNRCALIVNDVVTAVRTAAIFWHHLGIEAAPVLGQDRQTQLKQVHETILVEEGEEITQGGIHFASRWFSPVCPLLALVQSEDIWEFGKEPCHSLYQKKSPQQVNNVDANEDEDENGGEDRKEYFTCPLYYKCPRHQLEQDIAIAKIWVLTPASFIQTRVPRQVFREKITFAEAVYRECKFLFVDEADRVQIQFDDAFAPNDVLVDASEQAYLNKVGRYTSSIYHSARDRMAADRVVAWLSAQYYVQNVTNRIYNRLLTHEKLAQKHDKRETLADWLGLQPFTGRSLFAKIIREVTEPDNNNSQQYRKQTRQQRIEALRQRTATPSPSQQELQQKRRELLQELETFIPKPLDLECELSVLALRLLQPGDDQQAIAEVEKWCRKWLETDIKVFNKNIDYEELTRNVHFAILITVLEDQLAYLVDYLPYVRTILDLQDLDDNLLKRPPFDYLAVVPESPVGNILGFFYTRDIYDNSRGGKLEYFRYIGVGRALLQRFPTLFAIDGWEGPHTILISGTSYAPGSPKFQNSLYYTPPAYHIDVKPTVLLQPKPLADSARNTGIDASRFYFRPLPGYGGMPISISGCHSARKQNVRDLIQVLCSPTAGGLKLNDVFQSLRQLAENTQTQEEWADRQRFLMITGSYDEAEWAHAIAQPLCPDIPLEPLRRDQAPPNLRGIRRSKIQSLKDTPIQGIFAPLMALERGYNVLNQYDKAAFGAALFLNRPMPVPDDWASSVQQLNAWALKHEQDSRLFDINQPLTLIAAADAFYLNATNKLRELNSTAYSFRHMTDEERDILCWNQLVKVWQIIGRLVRGNVPAEVYFLDAKFAPFSAEGLTDKASTSLLVGMIEALEAHVEGEGLEPYQLSLARSLYSDFLTALKNTDGLKF